MTFSEYVKALYPFCGGGKTSANFVVALLSEATTEQNDPVFDKENDYLKKIFNGSKHISKTSASYISTHLNKEGLDNTFLNDIPSEDALIELCGVFEPIVGNSTTDDIATKLANLFVSIIKKIAQGKAVKDSIESRQVVYMDNSEVEKSLYAIIKKLTELSQKDLNIQLRYEPYNVETKIPNDTLLQNDVKNDVVLYYTYIESLLKQVSKTNTGFVDRLTKSVQNASDNYIAQGLTKQQVFSNMLQWIKFKTNSVNDMACKILISFFVQNCEVFRK